MKNQIKFLMTATALLVLTQASQAATVLWAGGAATDDWNGTDNWSTTYVPGNNGAEA